MGVKEFYDCYERCVNNECRIERLGDIKAYYECQHACEKLCRDKLF